ncbi:sulfate ABC transporter permease subunit CysT [Williamsia sp. CHRR-6]|uniref:sulfate ABC transporter permease subunit CysT n=1 Tax=Williamsia sp. CHRR-6 TaxID=2835871 RepID=UPI001BDA9941|nr:sulfate ABC transporter permease subunit CysT [Williamsia sp. CHRR-6]MBT0567839.1 sulfate ABC transporter permease subunit CysT [Williamsia sp. CHRR-6]
MSDTDTSSPVKPAAAPHRNPGAGRRRARFVPAIGVGVGTLWLSLIVLIPIAAIAAKSFENGWDTFYSAVTTDSAIASFKVTIGTSLVVTLINTVVGLQIAWVLTRDDFPGKGVVNALIDLPFALPTIVASIVLLSLYGPNSPVGIHVQQTKIGLGIALLFVTLPFVVRTVQPVLMELEADVEEAAATLGARNLTILRRIVLPALAPALLSGAGLAFSRAIGEFGSVVLIGGGIPKKTEVSSQYIRALIEQDSPQAAAAVSVVLLLASFLVLLVLRSAAAQISRKERRADAIETHS